MLTGHYWFIVSFDFKILSSGFAEWSASFNKAVEVGAANTRGF
jgi:hypothetical protein